MTVETQVLVIGGGLAGLSAGLFLARANVSVIVVEKHPGSSPHPRAIGYTPRTMQFVRKLGLLDQIPEVDDAVRLRRQRVYSLAGEWFEEQPWTPGSEPADMSAYSPVRGAAVAQDRIEPVLRGKAIELGADVRLSTRMLHFAQDDDGVTARVSTGDGEYDIRADYIIGADGNRSGVREALGIVRHGIGHVRTMHSILFRAPLEKYLERGISQFVVDQGDFNSFVTTYRDGRWVIYHGGDPVTDPAAQTAMILRSVGEEVPVEIVTSGTWELDGLIDDSYRAGRVFLMGDAAHTLPPTRGGWGANTGIDDANNLAWKLAAVLSGGSTPELLDSYDAERRPIGMLRHDQTFARPDYAKVAGDRAKRVELLSETAMELGQLYRSGAVIGAGPELPAAAEPDAWAGQPGTLARHVWLTRDGARLSTMDLYLDGWVLITADAAWEQDIIAAAGTTGIAVAMVAVGREVIEEAAGSFAAAYGLGTSGATLVRPDGYIAWRCVERPGNASDMLREALCAVASAARSTGG